MDNFWGRGRIQKLFLGLLIYTDNFCFLSWALFLLYHVVLSTWWVVVVGGGGGGGWFPAITLSQPNYSYGCFVVGVVVVVGLLQKQLWILPYSDYQHQM